MAESLPALPHPLLAAHSTLQGCTWFNLDGGQAPVYVRIAELALAADLRKR
jgi:hypothetical protein